MKLSDRQTRMVEYIRRYVRAHNRPPTIREIGAEVGISSTSVVNYNLKSLERAGVLSRSRDISRGLRLVDDPSPRGSLVRVPILGVIVASAPVPIPDSEFSMTGNEVVELTRDIVRDEEGIYALEVRGDSMIDALVNDGDIVVLKHQTEAHNGDMVAVWLRDEKEVTLKRFFVEGRQVRLQPANPTMHPIFVHPSNVEVQGKVIAVVRRLAKAS
jgi:repressor LexA